MDFQKIHDFIVYLDIKHDWWLYLMVFWFGIVPILLLIKEQIEMDSKKIESFPGEPPFKYKVLGGLIKADSYHYEGAMHNLTKKAKKMGADAIKDFKFSVSPYKGIENYTIVGVPIKRIK